MTEQETAFWDVIEVFGKEDLLPYVMIIGSWAEHIFQQYLIPGFTANLFTRDVDVFYPNLRKPANRKINISESLKEKGFIYSENRLTGVGKFFKEGLLELEFLTRVLGIGQPVNKIPSLNIRAEGIRELNMLERYPLSIDCKGYRVIVPEPEAYILQKLVINPTRKPDEKREKDIMALRQLMKCVNKDRVQEIYSELSKKEKRIIDVVSSANAIAI